MSHLPTIGPSSSLMSLDTAFVSMPGVPDPVYNPIIVDGLYVHSFFTTQTHFAGRTIEGITVDSDGIVLPSGYHFLLDPLLYYSSGSTWLHSPHFIWEINGVEQTTPKFGSHYASDNNLQTAPDSNNGRGYSGIIYVDCSLASKTLKLKAVGPWVNMGNVYFDTQQTNATLTTSNRSHILIHAFANANIINPTVRELIITPTTSVNGGVDGSYTTDVYFAGSGTALTLPVEALNKYFIFNGATSATYQMPALESRNVGDWIGLIQAKSGSSIFVTIQSSNPTQILVSSLTASSPSNGLMWMWTGSRWSEIPFSTKGVVKLPRA